MTDKLKVTITKTSDGNLDYVQIISKDAMSVNVVLIAEEIVVEDNRKVSDDGTSTHDKLVNRLYNFAAEMKRKLIKKRDAGYTGWDDSVYRSALETKLQYQIEHAELPEDYVDIANLAMFLYWLSSTQKLKGDAG
jgi:hypothetical protein